MKLLDYAEELNQMTTPAEKVETLIFYGSQLKDANHSNGFDEQDRIKGCISQTYLKIWITENKMQLSGYSESIVIRGLIYIMVDAFSGEEVLTKKEFNNQYQEFLEKSQITENMLPSRANSTISILNHILSKLPDSK